MFIAHLFLVVTAGISNKKDMVKKLMSERGIALHTTQTRETIRS
jgi:hypothetical protein